MKNYCLYDTGLDLVIEYFDNYRDAEKLKQDIIENNDYNKVEIIQLDTTGKKIIYN